VTGRRWRAVDTGGEAIPGLGAQVLAAVLNLLAWALLGAVLTTLAQLLQPHAPALAAVAGVVGFYALMSFWLSWLGYALGVPLLHRMQRRGRGGWAVVLAGGLIVGLVCAIPLHLASGQAGGAPLGWLAAGFGPPMALSYAAILRVIGRRRG